jgi:glycerol-3-phosphate acyltransferase PlsX
VGYVEGDHFYTGEVDLVVCDGFVGNVALKASEGLAKFFVSLLMESFNKNWYTKLSALIARPALRHLKKRFDPSRYNGASMLGLNGIVVKSHGGANELGFQHAIEQAVLEAENNVVDLVRAQINDFINQGLLL